MEFTETFEHTPTIEVNSKQGLVIPVEVLAKYGIQPGQKFVVLAYPGSIRLIPLVSIEEARGSMPGLDTNIDDEEGDVERV